MAIVVWQVRKSPLSASDDFLASGFLIGLGPFVGERSRWRPIVVALREALGEAKLASMTEGRETEALPETPSERIIELSVPEQRAVARAHRDPVRRFSMPLCMVALAALLLCSTVREIQATGWRLHQTRAAVLAVVATFEAGYVLARSRWQHPVARLRASGRSGPSASRPRGDAGE